MFFLTEDSFCRLDKSGEFVSSACFSHPSEGPTPLNVLLQADVY